MTLIDFDAYTARIYQLIKKKNEEQEKALKQNKYNKPINCKLK